MVKLKRDVLLLIPEDIQPSNRGLKVIGTYNPGAARLKNRDIILYVRVNEMPLKTEDNEYYYSPRSVSEDKYIVRMDKFRKNLAKRSTPMAIDFFDSTVRLKYISHFRRVILNKDGSYVKKIEDKPSFYGVPSSGELGIEDARITYLDKEKLYVMTYVSLSRNRNVSTSYAVSKDCINWHLKGILFREQNKDVVIFPGKVNGEYVAFNRPSGDFHFSLPNIWISYSKDLQHWGEDDVIKMSMGRSWDAGKVGAGAPPIKTKKGWLEIYHGVNKFHVADRMYHSSMEHGKKEEYVFSYCAGVALFDLRKPSRLIAKSKSNIPLLCPVHEYEKKGFVSNVVFPCGALLDESGENVLIFSGGADRVVTMKEISLKEIFKHLGIR